MRGPWWMSAFVVLGCGDDGASPDVATEGAETSDTVTPDVPDVPEIVVAPSDRLPGERRARTARCEAVEPTTCITWPSNAFVRLAETPTGLQLEVADDTVLPDEGIDLIEHADGFSRVAPIVIPVPLGVDAATIEVRLYVSEPGERFADEEIVRRAVFNGRGDTDPKALVIYPTRPLAAASEHTVVVMGSAPSRPTEVALGLVAPADPDEAASRAYHAVARAVLEANDVDPTSVGRVWDFTTRSADATRAPLASMAAAARADGVTVTIDSSVAGSDPIARIVEGHLDGIPDPTDPTEPGATYSVPFRVVVPAGDADYRVVMYAHGAGGNVHDSSFDALIAGAGAAKVNLEIDGWTDDTIVSAVTELFVPLVGSDKIMKRMRRSLAGGVAVLHQLKGALGAALAAETDGRRPLASDVIWAGGSLGGVTGMVFSHLEPSVIGGLLNVPGAGFTHWLAQSSFYDIIDVGLESRYPKIVDLQVVIAMAQQLFDEVDGASWARSRTPAPVFLVQMSVGDPVMPNIGTAMVATALGATIVGGAPVPVVGLAQADEAIGTSALTEYVTDRTSSSDVHGFAGTDAPAGIAARAQFAAFIESLWQHAPRVTVPPQCLALEAPLGPAGTCDFKE